MAVPLFHREVREPDRIPIIIRLWPANACDGDGNGGGFAACKRALRHRRGYLRAHCRIFFDRFGRDFEQFSLARLVIGNEAAQEDVSSARCVG